MYPLLDTKTISKFGAETRGAGLASATSPLISASDNSGRAFLEQFCSLFKMIEFINNFHLVQYVLGGRECVVKEYYGWQSLLFVGPLSLETNIHRKSSRRLFP